MKQLQLHATYEAANDAQLTLLAANIDATIEFVHGSVTANTPEGYALLVEEERFDEAAELLSFTADETHESLLRCPTCGSDRLLEPDPGIWGVLLLGLPYFTHMIARWTSGAKYRCEDCRHEFRKKL